jgi:phenylalanyl-tRNA synthetase beta chain
LKISLDWLGDFVSWDDTPEDLAAKLTAAGLNVEGIEEFRQSFPGVVVAKVLERDAHPDADRLSVCKVDDGTGESVQVVCGAPNVRAGLTVLFARVGALLPGDFKIKKSKIRGVKSMGMICSATELNVPGGGEGIMELETDLPVGTSADELYGFSDTVLDIEVTPNRPDWLSHVGVAREVAAIYKTKMALPPVWNSQMSGESLGTKVRIENYEDCQRYTAFGANNITVGDSPEWMQRRLLAVGSRPINNVVDITNYVMLELGQPQHAFDRSKLSGTTITIKRAEAGMTVTTLDDQQRKLEADTLLVCDEKGPVALAGVMGLANSEVDENTTDVLLESAFFDPLLVRKASRNMNLISDSSYRFERGADWDMVPRAAHRALHLFQDLCGAIIVADWADRFDPDREAAKAIPLRIWQVNRVLGTDITTDEAAQLLQALGLKVQPMGNASASNPNAVNIMVSVPSFRRDLFQEVDLIEEIARSYGLDNLPSASGFRGGAGSERRTVDVFNQKVRHWFSARGYSELVTSSFQLPGEMEKMQLDEDDMRRESLAVLNPHHGGDTLLRTLVLPSFLDVARRNLNAGVSVPLRSFQINGVFWPGGKKPENPRHADEVLLPEENRFLQWGIAGSKEKSLDGLPADLMEIKGVISALASHVRLTLDLEVSDVEPWMQAGAQWRITNAAGDAVGYGGLVDPEVCTAFDIDASVAVAEINLDLLDLTPESVQFESFTRFPSVKRDLSLLVPEGVTYGEIEETVKESGGKHLASVSIFDVYRGKGVPEGSGAYGIRLKFSSAKGSLKGKSVDRAIGIILEALASRLKIEARG